MGQGDQLSEKLDPAMALLWYVDPAKIIDGHAYFVYRYRPYRPEFALNAGRIELRDGEVLPAPMTSLRQHRLGWQQ